MFVTKCRPGAGSGSRRNRTIEDTASRIEGTEPSVLSRSTLGDVARLRAWN
jgi:hypothetical protein